MTTAGAHPAKKARNGGTRAPKKRRQWNWFKSITWRSALLLAALCLIGGYVAYLQIYQSITGGITHEGNLTIVNLQSMSSFEMDQINGTTEDIPPRFRALDGQRVRLTGQMFDPYQSEGNITHFSLVYSINNCCFNGPPKIQHFVQATVKGKPIEFTQDFVDVTGTLHVGVEKGEKGIESVYRIDVDGVTAE